MEGFSTQLTQEDHKPRYSELRELLTCHLAGHEVDPIPVGRSHVSRRYLLSFSCPSSVLENVQHKRKKLALPGETQLGRAVRSAFLWLWQVWGLMGR